MSKFVEYFKGKFDSTISEKIKPENRPYIAYSAVDGLTYSEAVKENTINYFYIESLEDNNVITLDSTTWIGTNDNKSKLEYSNNATDWISMSGVDAIIINNRERLYMRCVKENICKSDEDDKPLFNTSLTYNVSGNLHTVMFKYDEEITSLTSYCFSYLFWETKVVDASKLLLPATELAEWCYYYMFEYCTSLTAAPEILPATELAEGCYSCMFDSCTSLTAAPELPATMLANDCYQTMFGSCTSLTTAPELPATTLADYCYYSMFSDCTSLTTAPELPATELAEWCYGEMFSGCTSLTPAPELPANTLAECCYYYMFEYCTSLTTAPELPATKLEKECYEKMFSGCTNLNYIKCLATNMSARNCTNYWIDGVSNTGTFVKHPDATWQTGTKGIPEGWSVIDAEL